MTMFDFKGFYHCGRCGPCRSTKPAPRKRTTFISHQTFKQYPIKNVITCGTRNVTYVMECTCGYQYVGRTSRTLSKQISEHIMNICKGFPKHSVSNHFRLKHQKNFGEITFYTINCVKGHWRGSNMIQKISQNENRWIFELQMLTSQGLNVELDLNCFITNYSIFRSHL